MQNTIFSNILVLTGDHRLTDDTKPGGTYSQEDLKYHQAMQDALLSLPDYSFEFVSDHTQFLQRISLNPPEFVLNLCDTGFRNVASQELHVPALLEMFSIPYSGAPPACMAICYDKAIVRLAALALDIPVPTEIQIKPNENLAKLKTLEYPALIKPNQADGSLGITKDAVVHDAQQAGNYIHQLWKQLPGRMLLVQEYLSGAEYGLALIGNPADGFVCLPPLEVDYAHLPAGLAPILGYESKTDPESPYWTKIKFNAAQLPDNLLEQISEHAKNLFARLDCRDYARFDFRTGKDGIIKLMEVNPNPAWDPTAKLAMMTALANKSYAQMFAMILHAAQARLQQSSS